MTINEVLLRVNRDRPGESGDEEKLRWLSQMDMKWFDDVILTHEHEKGATFEGYGNTTSLATELLIKAPWDEAYVYHLYAAIDFRLGEVDRYNNSAALDNQMQQEARRAYHRTHLPLQPCRIRHVMAGDSASSALPEELTT